MMLPEVDVHTASIDALVAACSSPSCVTLGKEVKGSGRTIVRISEQVVIKCGLRVTESEANNQRGAYLLLDPCIVRVPQVYRFFSYGLRGYIVMEYIKGEILTPLEDPNRIRKVASALAHMQDISRRVPGPLRSGVPRGLLWPEDEDLTFADMLDVEGYFNSRLAKGSPRLAFGQCRVVLCHLDVAPRNILWLEDGSMCLLDWECAGFYPRILEVCAQRIIAGKEGEFNMMLLECMDGVTDEEEVQAGLIMRAFANGQRYHLWVVAGRKVDYADFCSPPFKSSRQVHDETDGRSVHM